MPLDEEDKAILKRALECIRASGRDPDAVIAEALVNLNAWRALSHDERVRIAAKMDEDADYDALVAQSLEDAPGLPCDESTLTNVEWIPGVGLVYRDNHGELGP